MYIVWKEQNAKPNLGQKPTLVVGSKCIIHIWVWKNQTTKKILNMKYLTKGIKLLFMVVYLMELDAHSISNSYEMKRSWIVKI
jgi:hypothetical protein